MSLIDRPYNEKRDYIRMRINSVVHIRQSGNDYEGICRDLSGAGMLVETSQTFAIGAELEISIEQKAENHLPFNAIAEVSRVDDGPDGKHIIGLIIKQIIE